MNYDRKRLRKLARDVLKIAQDNLRRDGYLKPVGLVYTSTGLSHIFPFRCRELSERRESQRGYKQLLSKLAARAAVVVTESWLKMAPDRPLDPTKSLATLTDRQEAIVIEAASPKARCLILQVVTRDATGKVHFETPIEPDQTFSWSSEWLDGVWDHFREIG